MPYCSVCGTELNKEGLCPQCSEGHLPEPKEKPDSFSERLNDTRDHTDEFEEEDILANRTNALLAYFGLLILVPLITAPTSDYVRYHCSESLDLMLTTLLWGILTAMFSAMAFHVAYAFGWLILGIFLILGLVPTVLWVLGIYHAAQGQAKDLPFIGKLKLLK